MAKALGIGKSQCARDRQDGMPMHSVDAARAWRVAHRDVSRSADGRPGGQASPPPPAGEDDAAAAAGDPLGADYRQARTERERIAAKRAQIELDQLRGQLIGLADARRVAFTAFRALRDAILQIPARVKDQLAASTDAMVCEALLDAELSAALGASAAAALPTGDFRDEPDEGDDEPD